jgi:hypothetical protein
VVFNTTFNNISFIYRVMTSARPCNKVSHLFLFTILAQHETDDVILYIHSVQREFLKLVESEWSIIIFSKYFKIQFAWSTFQKRSWSVMTITSTNRKGKNGWEIQQIIKLNQTDKWDYLGGKNCHNYYK